ncbi:hypothetical protein Hanom_Chr17g01547071 [Helianthus anomalus]
MKVVGVDVNSKEEESVSSDQSSQSSDENSKKATVFDQTPSDSSFSDDSSEKSIDFDQSPTDDSGDDKEEKHINVAKAHLSPESFQFYFADRLEKLKKRRGA